MGYMKKHDFFFQGKYVYNVYERRNVSVVFLIPQILLDCKNVETTQFSCGIFIEIDMYFFHLNLLYQQMLKIHIL